MKATSKSHVLLALILFLIALPLTSGSALAQEKMSMDEYRAQLAEWQNREADAKASIEKVDGEIEALKQDIDVTQTEIDGVWTEIYAMLGTDKAGVDAFKRKLQDIEDQVDGLAALSPEELFKRRAELDELEAQLDELKGEKIAALSEIQDMAATTEGKISQQRNRMPKAIYDEYVVVKGDYLWRISRKPDIYGDGLQWIRIYSYNRDQIKDPDLIYSDQVFKIQREVGPNEYLVMKGQDLGKVAGDPEVFGDPAKWTKIYEANKDVVGDDPDMIYPYQVLVIPNN